MSVKGTTGKSQKYVGKRAATVKKATPIPRAKTQRPNDPKPNDRDWNAEEAGGESEAGRMS